jgi:hypothetical protein
MGAHHDLEGVLGATHHTDQRAFIAVDVVAAVADVQHSESERTWVSQHSEPSLNLVRLCCKMERLLAHLGPQAGGFGFGPVVTANDVTLASVLTLPGTSRAAEQSARANKCTSQLRVAVSMSAGSHGLADVDLPMVCGCHLDKVAIC